MPLSRCLRDSTGPLPNCDHLHGGYVSHLTSATTILGLEERELTSGGARLRYYAGGEGDAVVLVHGLAGTAANWVELIPKLVTTNRVLVVDLPGHGGSEPRRRATMSDFAASVAAVIEAEAAAPAVVAGHSFGGQVVIRLAQARPDLVRGLLLAAPSGIATVTRASQIVVWLTGVIRPGRLVSPLRHRYADRDWYRTLVFGPYFVSDPLALSPRAVHGFLAGLDEHGDIRTAGWAMGKDDPRADLEGIECPVLVLWGARDVQLRIDDAFEYTRRLRARLRVVADCGHLVIGERPDACLDALAALGATR